MDHVIRLRELRARAGLTQEQAAEKSGIGAKTISSFESGTRIDAMKISQLERLLTVYGSTLPFFFSDQLAAELRGLDAPAPPDPDAFRVEDLPAPIRASLAAWASRITSVAAIHAMHRPASASHAR
ncbi:MAG: helix-turn-helix transcriptional regulator [Thermoanaerobaculia bacterium]|jgi:transcriptional regulator with XRE-family HTH domain